MTTKLSCTALFVCLAALVLGSGSVQAGSDILMIPAAGFATDGASEDDYINYGDYLETSKTLHFHAWVQLPHNARITNVDMMTRDDGAGTITGYLKRTPFATNGDTETLLTFTSPGNIGCTGSGLCHDMESLLDIPVDAVGYGYWFDVVVPDAQGSPDDYDLAFYAVRIMYDYQETTFSDGFESGDTSEWTLHAPAKSATAATRSFRKDLPSSPSEDREAELLEWLYTSFSIDDPQAAEALGKALLGKAGYASPYVIPGPGFKTAGYIEYDDYYFSEGAGFVYVRPSAEDGTIMHAPVNLPDGAEIAWYFAFYVDSVRTGTSADIRFWLSRMDAADIIPTDNLVYEVTSGRDTEIQAISADDDDMEAAVPGSTTVNNALYSYWATIDVGPYDVSPPNPYQDEEWWHKVYAIVILYTMP
jgi:hypothetical protein